MMPVKTNYLTNREFLYEINKSKISYCEFIDRKYQDYHQIVETLGDITDELIAQIIEAKANPRGKVEPIILAPDEVVFRVMTFEHIPLDPDRKRKARNTDQSYAWTNFPPFKHYVRKDGELIEVGRSHWKGSFDTGSFTIDKGRMTDQLGRMFLLLVERIGRKPNFRGYSYLDEMQAHALANLAQVGLQFNELRSLNPFSFFTSAVTNSFIRVLNIEKRSQNIRDELLIDIGMAPSGSRQLDDELQMTGLIQKPKPIGRPKRASGAVIE